jgi:hypothetical protein
MTKETPQKPLETVVTLHGRDLRVTAPTHTQLLVWQKIIDRAEKVSPKDLESRTVAELKELATKEGVSLPDGARKDTILVEIRRAQW